MIKQRAGIGDSLRSFILGRIREGKWAPGSRIPGLRELGGEFNVSQATVQRIFDELARERVLVAVHGSGTYVSDDVNTKIPLTPLEKNILVMMPDMPDLESLKDEALKKSILVSHYCTSEDRQSVDKERQLLLAALRNKYMGVILMPSPLPPTNRDLFGKMRREGVKVLLTGHYDYIPAMAGESYLLPDFEMASRTALTKMALAGYRNFIYMYKSLNTGFYLNFLRRGYDDAARELSLRCLPPADISTEDITEIVRKLPRRTAVITPHPSGAEDIMGVVRGLGRASARDIGVICSFGNPKTVGVDCMSFDYQILVKRALEYICDSSIPADRPYHEFFRADYVKAESREG